MTFISMTGIKMLNERISRSTFGFPVNYRSSAVASMPSNRFPQISGNGRYIYYSSDSSGGGGLVFDGSNQIPSDNDGFRDVFVYDTKTAVETTVVGTITPTINLMGSLRNLVITAKDMHFGPIPGIN